MNQPFDEAAIQRFLDAFPHKSQRLGRQCYVDGAVLQLECAEPDEEYDALVRGSFDYEVHLGYHAQSEGWMADCTCPMEFHCKHAYAAMLALQLNAPKLSRPGAVVTIGGGPRANLPLLRQAVQVPQAAQSIPSPLLEALGKKLERRLTTEEVNYVQRVAWLAQEASRGQALTAATLRQLAPALQEYSWSPLELWPERPRNDLEFWLYCAWELRRRGLSTPGFLEPVTDFSLIEPQMLAWERRKHLEHWQRSLEFGARADQPDAEPVDFRLMILPGEARVEWKTVSEPSFRALKQTHLRGLNATYESGELVVVPDAHALWLMVHDPYDSYSGCRLGFDDADTAKILGRALRLPVLADRIVTSEGRPLARPAQPLRYHLEAARDESDDYRVDLVQADGSPAPEILLVTPGRPTLYLTEQAVYQGPPPHGYGLKEPVRIPAPALESLHGVNFLQRLNLDLPPRITAKVRRVDFKVKVHCEIRPAYYRSRTDALFVRAISELEGTESEQCSARGWEPVPSGRIAQQPRHPAAQNGSIPLVDRSAQRHFPSRLQSLGAKWDDGLNLWRMALNKKFPEVFVPWLESLPPEVEVHLDPELATLRNGTVTGKLQLDLEEAGVDWFDLKVALNVSDLTLTSDELKLLLNARGGFVRLGKKGWRRLQFDLTPEDDERMAKLGLNPRDFTSEPQRLHALQLADETARKFFPEPQAERIQRRVADLKARVTPPLPERIDAQLRPYQVDGFHFLAYLTANRFGGVLADDMGLGKTLQTLTWLAWLREGSPEPASPPNGADSQNGHDPAAPLPCLVACPKSVMDNWRAEAQRFYPGLRVRLWQGEDAAELAAARAQADLIVCNYAQLRSLSPQIAEHHWLAAVLDEAQYIKNPDSQTAQVARTLRAEHRLALTGTPIENRLLDLWSIFSFTMPGVLGNRAHFVRRFNLQEDPLARRRLAARVRPFLLRRLKNQVARDLPDRVEEDLVCEMEGQQNTLYRAEFKRAQQMLLAVHTQQQLNQQRFHFLTSLLRLRQICCHPALVNDDLRQSPSAKVEALLDLLEPLMDEGHKVLIFSQFVTMLDLLREMITERGWPQFYLAGDTDNRGELVGQFQRSSGAAIFLLSLKAGGFGLNLAAASYVVLFDPWWNPAVERQAIDRTHRIGQTSKVIAYRLLIKDSIEQKIRQLQRSKAALAEEVLGEERFGQSLTLDDLRVLFADD